MTVEMRSIDCYGHFLGHDQALRGALFWSIGDALRRPWVVLSAETAEAVIANVLQAVGRDIANSVEGRLLTRFLANGPLDEQQPFDSTVGEPHQWDEVSKTPLSDLEAETMLRFVHSHMINRFKGELAELLALNKVIPVIESRYAEELNADNLRLCWGDTVRTPDLRGRMAKGPDGLLLSRATDGEFRRVRAVIEIKAMRRGVPQIRKQIDQHVSRLRLGAQFHASGFPDRTTVAQLEIPEAGLLKVAVRPRFGMLDRRFYRTALDSMPIATLSPDVPVFAPPHQQNGVLAIELDHHGETLDEAGYEMTLGYLGSAAQEVFKLVPAERDTSMQLEHDTQNRAKHMLHLLGLRPLRDSERRVAANLYNVYCYSYPLAADSRVMLWPEDFENGYTGHAPAVRDWRGPRSFGFDAKQVEKLWRAQSVRTVDGSPATTFDRIIGDLAPAKWYAVAFHVGCNAPMQMHASAGPETLGANAVELERHTQEQGSHPFEDDPSVYRAGFSSTSVTTDQSGRARVSLTCVGDGIASSRARINRIVIAFDPG